MNISLPLEQMTVEEKLQMMEAIWDDLSQNSDEIQPPSWHGKVLDQPFQPFRADEPGYLQDVSFGACRLSGER
jgi:hypothetical protein